VAQPDEANAETSRPESITELFAALESPLLSYALRLLHDLALAEDTVQEAFCGCTPSSIRSANPGAGLSPRCITWPSIISDRPARSFRSNKPRSTASLPGRRLRILSRCLTSRSRAGRASGLCA